MDWTRPLPLYSALPGVRDKRGEGGLPYESTREVHYGRVKSRAGSKQLPRLAMRMARSAPAAHGAATTAAFLGGKSTSSSMRFESGSPYISLPKVLSQDDAVFKAQMSKPTTKAKATLLSEKSSLILVNRLWDAERGDAAAAMKLANKTRKTIAGQRRPARKRGRSNMVPVVLSRQSETAPVIQQLSSLATKKERVSVIRRVASLSQTIRHHELHDVMYFISMQRPKERYELASSLVAGSLFFTAIRACSPVHNNGHKDEKMMNSILADIRAVIVLSLEPGGVWKWPEVDRTLMMTQFAPLSAVTAYRAVRPKLMELGVAGLEAIDRLERNLVLTILTDMSSRYADNQVSKDITSKLIDDARPTSAATTAVIEAMDAMDNSDDDENTKTAAVAKNAQKKKAKKKSAAKEEKMRENADVVVVERKLHFSESATMDDDGKKEDEVAAGVVVVEEAATHSEQTRAGASKPNGTASDKNGETVDQESHAATTTAPLDGGEAQAATQRNIDGERTVATGRSGADEGEDAKSSSPVVSSSQRGAAEHVEITDDSTTENRTPTAVEHAVSSDGTSDGSLGTSTSAPEAARPETNIHDEATTEGGGEPHILANTCLDDMSQDPVDVQSSDAVVPEGATSAEGDAAASGAGSPAQLEEAKVVSRETPAGTESAAATGPADEECVAVEAASTSPPIVVTQQPVEGGEQQPEDRKVCQADTEAASSSREKGEENLPVVDGDTKTADNTASSDLPMVEASASSVDHHTDGGETTSAEDPAARQEAETKDTVVSAGPPDDNSRPIPAETESTAMGDTGTSPPAPSALDAEDGAIPIENENEKAAAPSAAGTRDPPAPTSSEEQPGTKPKVSFAMPEEVEEEQDKETSVSIDRNKSTAPDATHPPSESGADGAANAHSVASKADGTATEKEEEEEEEEEESTHDKAEMAVKNFREKLGVEMEAAAAKAARMKQELAQIRANKEAERAAARSRVAAKREEDRLRIARERAEIERKLAEEEERIEAEKKEKMELIEREKREYELRRSESMLKEKTQETFSSLARPSLEKTVMDVDSIIATKPDIIAASIAIHPQRPGEIDVASTSTSSSLATASTSAAAASAAASAASAMASGRSALFSATSASVVGNVTASDALETAAPSSSYEDEQIKIERSITKMREKLAAERAELQANLAAKRAALEEARKLKADQGKKSSKLLSGPVAEPTFSSVDDVKNKTSLTFNEASIKSILHDRPPLEDRLNSQTPPVTHTAPSISAQLDTSHSMRMLHERHTHVTSGLSAALGGSSSTMPASRIDVSAFSKMPRAGAQPTSMPGTLAPMMAPLSGIVAMPPNMSMPPIPHHTISNTPNLTTSETERLADVMDYAVYLGMDPIADKDLFYIAEWAINAPLPSGWTEHLDEENNEFYHNSMTGVSTYEHPLDEQYRAYYRQIKAQRQAKGTR